MAQVKNPPFPHHCRVYKTEGVTSWSDGRETVLYEGVCHVEVSSSKRTFKHSGVVKSDYALYIPGLVRGVCSGCQLDVEDYTGSYKGIVVSDASPSEMGTTLYYNQPKN